MAANLPAREKAKRISYAEQAYQKIKEMILREQLKQGSVVSILHLAKELGVGRTPVTIACQRLEYDGFVKIIPKQGVLINPMTVQDVRELFESRLAIELFVVTKAFDFLTPKDVEILERSIAKQIEYGEEKDYFGFMEEDTFFHRQVMVKYTNDMLLSMYDNLFDRIFMFGIKNSKNPARLRQSIENHQAIVEAIKRQDKKEFIEQTEIHIVGGYTAMTSFYYT